MKHEFRLADIGEGLEEAEIIEWRVELGESVQRDQPLIEVMTDKSNAELPAPFTGTIVQLGGEVGDMIAVGELIAVIEDDVSSENSAGQTAPSHGAARAEASTAAPVDVAPVSDQAPASPPTARPKAAPTTRREAVRRGIDLTTVVGSGPGGRILLPDLDLADTRATPVAAEPTLGTTPAPPPATDEAVAATPSPPTTTPPPAAPLPADTPDPTSQQVVPAAAAPSDPQPRPLRGMRRRIAKNMMQSWSEIPHIHAFEHIDAQPLIEVRGQLKATARSEYDNLTLLSFFVAGLASALRAFPQANASLDMAAETITEHGSINIGVAVAAPHGLVVPVIHDADTMSFGALCQHLHATVAGARAGTLQRDGFVGGTATITNFGSLGGEKATPLIRPSESIIVGFGSVAERPFVVDGAVEARRTMHVVIGADHRLLDGDVTTALLRHLTDCLIAPLDLVLGR